MKQLTQFTAAGAALCALAVPGAAFAQDADPVSSSVDAFAFLTEQPIDPPPPSILTVNSTVPLVFGALQIPKAAPEGNKCVYSLSVAGSVTSTTYSEVDANGNVVGSNSPDTTNCSWTTDGTTPVPPSFEIEDTIGVNPGILWLTCDPDRVVNYAVQYQNATSGLLFNAPPQGRVAIYSSPDPSTYDPINIDLRGSPNCGDGGLVFWFGGELTVTRDAVGDGTGTPTSVGSIQFEANY